MKKPLYTIRDIASRTMRNSVTVREWCQKAKLRRVRKLGSEFSVKNCSLKEFLRDEHKLPVIDMLPPLPDSE